MMPSMRTLLAVLLGLGTLGVAKADPPASTPVLIAWKLKVTDSNNEEHSYTFLRTGGPVKVDTGDWTCSYAPVKAKETAGIYTEGSSVTCTAGKHTVRTAIMCGGPRMPGGGQSINLIINANNKTDMIVVDCAPQE
jgi:hypothetical protein